MDRPLHFAGYTAGTAGATFTGLETGILTGSGAAMNFLFAGLAFELGVGIGSAINAAIDMQLAVEGCNRLECE